MKRYGLVVICWCLALSLSAQSEGEKSLFDYEVALTSDWVFYAPDQPRIDVEAVNKGNIRETSTLQLRITRDTHEPLYTFSQAVPLAAGESTRLQFAFSLPEPGFYRCLLTEHTEGKEVQVKRFNIGYEPEQIISLPDAQPDLKQFWDRAKEELAQVAPDYQLTLIPESSDNRRKLYLVKMKSLGGEEISGYYSVPTKKGKYPAIISYMGYGSKPWIPGGTPGYVEFVLSVRGQALQEPVNTYGDWITYGLDNKESYYYRGAFMDLIRAIDFVASRAEVRTDAIFAEGGSQGGAFSMAAAALDHRLRAIGPSIPFLSDYPDYFRIVHWPAQPVLAKQRELGLTEEEMYRTLSYFDIKNLAAWIDCPVIMGIGLQDEVCPPHINFSGYNRISAEKKYHIYPVHEHNTPDSWWKTRMDFFAKYQ